MYRCEDVKMRSCEDVKMICVDVMMRNANMRVCTTDPHSWKTIENASLRHAREYKQVKWSNASKMSETNYGITVPNHANRTVDTNEKHCT